MDAARRFEQIYRQQAMMNGGVALGGVALGGIRHKPLKRTKKAVAARKAYREDHPKPHLLMDEKHVKARKQAKKDQRYYDLGVKYAKLEAEKKKRKTKRTTKRKPAGAASSGQSDWIKFVKKIQKQEDVSYGEAMQIASPLWKKKAKK
jgi:hypothetical protein